MRERLREREAEIVRLREKLAVCQRKKKGPSLSSSADAQRVKQLERQVQGLNDIIRRRFPNSLSALIIASGNSSSSHGEHPASRSTN